VLQPDANLAARLALGQLVRAQVLEHQEGSRYVMRILGQTVVAESPVALRAGDIFHGRVVGLQDRIQLERIEEVSGQASTEETIAGLGAGRAAEIIEELFRRYRGTLDARQAQALERLVARSSRPERMALAGLVLRKVGLPLDSGLLEALVLAIGGELEPIAEQVLELQAGTAGDVVAPAPVQWSPAQRVLNAQGGGTVSHQLGVLPLALDGRVVEVEVALFEENEGRERPEGLRHRKLVLALDTDALGRVQARAVTAGDHIRVALGTESSAATNALLRYGEGLAHALAAAGWRVDEVTHETRARADMSAPVSAAVEHLVTPGSINRVL
jgi:hypothetical protein